MRGLANATPGRGTSILVAAGVVAACAPPVDFGAEQGPEAPASVEIGSRLLAASEAEMALDAFLRLIAEEGVSAPALNGVGAAYYRMGRPGDARRFFRSAVELDPNDAEARNNLGVTLYDEGEYEAALFEFERAFALTSGQDQKVLTNIGMTELALAGRRDHVVVDEAEFDVIQYGQGFYRLERRRPDSAPVPIATPRETTPGTLRSAPPASPTGSPADTPAKPPATKSMQTSTGTEAQS